MVICTSTFLYIKRHRVTGLLYFGKTTEANPIKYPGSGTAWTEHLREHGNDVETLWYCLFTSRAEMVEFALMCSDMWDIVLSEDWANKVRENGRGGRVHGDKFGPHSDVAKARISTAKQKRFRVVDPNGNAHEDTGLHKFCIANGLKVGAMSMVLRKTGRIKHHKGWTGSYLSSV